MFKESYKTKHIYIIIVILKISNEKIFTELSKMMKY